MTRECDACDETFQTLTRKRLHDCPADAEYGTTDAPDADIPVADMDLDDMVSLAVEQVLICDVCGESVEGAETIDTAHSNRGVSIAVTFDCPACGAANENTAVVE